jgi:RNA-directed DNA polymerase
MPWRHDRALQAFYLQALDPIADTLAEPNSDGFRRERSPADAIEPCQRGWSLRWSALWRLAGDSRSCLDRTS